MTNTADIMFRLVKDISDARRNWLEKKALSEQLRECKADCFAAITHRQDARTTAEKERLARMDKEWSDYRNSMLLAEDEERRARLWMKQKETEFDALRTVNANARKEMDTQGLIT